MSVPGDPTVGLELSPRPADPAPGPAEREVVGPIHLSEVEVSVLTAGELYLRKEAEAEASAEQLIQILSQRLRPGLPPEIQEEVASLITLISDIAYEEFTEYFPLLRIAVEAVVADPPNLVLARRIRKAVVLRTHLLLRPLLFLRTGHPAVQVILGLFTALALLVPVGFVLFPWLAGYAHVIPGDTDHIFVLVGMAGGVGSIVSMLVRIKDFDNEEAEHRAILFFTGFFKPVIGIASALFVVLILEAELVNIAASDVEGGMFLYLAIAFVAGFSERLASDIVSQTEGRLKPAAEAKARG